MAQTSVTQCRILEWDAWLDTMPPGPSRLHVHGTARCPTAGYSLKVVRRDPQGINPKMLLLQLEETPPRVGAQVVSEISFDHSEPASLGQFDEVDLAPVGTRKVRIAT